MQVRSGAERRWVLLLTVLPMLLVVVALVSCSVGAVHIPVGTMVRALLGRGSLTETQRLILYEIRLPRVLASGVVGAALAVSGLMFQGLFRNPMADPYVIGSSGGAVLGACVGVFFLSEYTVLGFSATALLAFAGSVGTMVLVYALARSGGRTNVVTLLLAGFAVSTMLGYSTYFFEMMDSSSGSNSRVLIAWLHGVIGIPRWSQMGVTGVLLAVAMMAAVPLMRRLNTLSLGDEYAQGLGMRVEATRVCLIVVGSMLTAAAVSLGGLISFAGLIVPHVARLLLGPDHVRLLPVTALAGAIFLMVADTLARTVFAPSELPVGVLMALLGGPFFLYLLRKTKRGYAV
jgi:iron complex transport system permease protein